jgi:uncharacterized RDD family membrane protein YckC
MFCVQCGGEIPAGSRFCPRCGRAAPSPEAAATDGAPSAAGPEPPAGQGPSSTAGQGPPSGPPGPPTMPPPPSPPPPPSLGSAPPPGAYGGPSGGYPPSPPPPPAGGYPPPPPGAYPPPPPAGYPAPPSYYGAAGGGPVAYGLASFGQRAAALIIDSVVVGAIYIVGIIVAVIATPSATYDNPSPSPNGFGLLFMLLTWLAALVYYPFFEGKPAGQTLGKKAMGIRVVRRSNGAPLGYGLAIGRVLARFVEGFTFGIGLLLALFDDQNQTIHDKIAGTLVVRSSVYPPPGATPPTPGYQQPAPPPSPYQTG